MRPLRLAALDLGTVTTRLLVADVSLAGIHELTRRTTITHLGEGLLQSGRISEAALQRELAACKDFLAAITELASEQAVEKTVAFATSAMRDATNSAQVQEALRAEGIEVEVISGAREAQLSFLGTLSGFANDGQLFGTDVLTVDIGGGSTEVILGTVVQAGGRWEPQIACARSFDIGSRRVSDLFLHSNPPSAAELEQAGRWIREQMRPYFCAFSRSPQVMLAVAGTATTAVAVQEGMAEYDSERVHGYRLDAATLAAVTSKLAQLSLEERREVTGLEPSRASVIVGGLLTLQAVLELSGLPAFTVSETDILQGALLDAYAREEQREQ
ncbi:MAG: hypothetical protein LBU48_01090 [Coriobacteriales bacterium]|jgi:exopolyphosphatase/guanosine-5'-triphosphate,3'-diphosphate pyrophosphatase|nr:hypothetical protein [Coriobacteriales bacterium]